MLYINFINQTIRLTKYNRVIGSILIQNTLDWKIIIFLIHKYKNLIYENETVIRMSNL